MQLDGATFDQYSFEGLNTQTVQRWGTVQQDRMVFDDLFQYIPHFRLDTLNKAFRTLDVMGKVLLNQLTHDEWLEEFQCHTFWQTTLVQLQIRSDHDYRATRV